MPLVRNVFKPLAKSAIIPLGLTAAAAATDAAIHKKMFRSGMTTLLNSDEDTKIVKSLEESGLLIKDVSQTIKHEAKGQKAYLGMLLGTLGARLLGNLLTGKGTIRAGKKTIRAGYTF